MARICLALLLMLQLAFLGSCQEDADWMSCEGFVKLSPKIESKMSSVALDYSKLELHLTNEKGHVKDTTQFSPDGYYALPVYDTGVFKLRIQGPSGWSFEQTEVKIHSGVGGKRTCSEGEINFEFLGFGLSGKVESLSSAGCPAAQGLPGIVVTLTSKEGDSKIATTDQTGLYSFKLLLPGQYTITAERTRQFPAGDINPLVSRSTIKYASTWQFQGNGMVVELLKDNLEVAEPLRVSGANMFGYAVSDDEPMRNVEVSLNAGDKFLEKVTTDENGVFAFSGLACGKYQLTPHYKGFQVSPKVMPVTIAAGDSVLEQPFRFLGFALKGSVVDQSGAGVPGVTVVVLNEKTSLTTKLMTDADGSYSVDHATTGKYSLSASKTHLVFDAHPGLVVSPSMDALPAMTVVAYGVCGKVIVNGGLGGDRTVVLSAKGGQEEKTSTDKKGAFCFNVPSGQYSVAVQVDSRDKQNGLIFYPAQYPVTVDNEPVVNVMFSQALVKVDGKVSCIGGACPAGLTVQLSGVGRAGTWDQKLSGDDGFAFDNVLPGKYTVSVVRADWCWEQSLTTITVSDQDVTVQGLAQAGWKMPYALSQDDLTVEIEAVAGPALPKKEWVLRRAEQSLCLPRPGKYTVTPRSCFKFENDVYQFDTAAPSILELFMTGFEVTGTIVVAQEMDEAAKASDLIVHVSGPTSVAVQGSSSLTQKKQGQKGEAQVKVVKAKYSKKVAKGHEFSFSFFSLPNEQLELTPKALSLLFYPESRSLAVPKSQCPEPVPAFTGRDGMYTTGTIRPAVEGVQASITHNGVEAAQPVLTDASGQYRIGPLYEDRTYQIHVQKKGYVFTQVEGSSTDFAGQRLSTIVVRAVDKATKQPLPSVFISLSGKSYRNNTSTQANGEQEFISLPPGSFFLRPMLKEYEFEPKTKNVELTEGALVEVEVVGKRVAFSCFGTVRSLSGLPEAGVGVEARGAEGQLEETQTDKNGQFRIRGLNPGASYTVRLQAGPAFADKSKVPLIERGSPEEFSVTMGHEDITDIHFTAFRSLQTFDLAGMVECDAQWLEQLQVQLVVPSSGAVVMTVPVIQTRYFELSGIPLPAAGAYNLRVTNSLGRNYITKGSQVKVVPFKEGSRVPRVEVSLSFTAEQKVVVEETPSNPTFAFILLGAALLVAKYWSEISEALEPYIADERKLRPKSFKRH